MQETDLMSMKGTLYVAPFLTRRREGTQGQAGASNDL